MKSLSPTLSERFVACASARPDAVAMTLLRTGHSDDMTFGVMLKQVCCIAYGLIQEGINPGDRVAIIGENHPNWAIAYLGILHRGAVATPLDPTATAKTLATFLLDSDSKLAFVSTAYLNKFREACAYIGRNIPLVLLEPSAEMEQLACFTDWVSASISERCNIATSPVDSTDLALLIYTSGTTGRPKGVPLSHGNLQAQINAVEEIMRVTENEVVFSILPLFHAYSQIINLWLAATIGARVVYLNQLGITEIKDGLKQSGATVLIGVPLLWYFIHQRIFESVNAQPTPVRWLLKMMMAANGALRDYAHVNLGPIIFRPVHRALGGQLRLAVSGGATFDKGVAKDLYRVGFTILQGYGLTETSGAVTATRFEDNRVGSVGKPFGKNEIKLTEQDATGIGEVLIRGPSVMKGYYNNEEDTAQAFTSDGWFRSGDLGYVDKQGYLYIVGRKKDTIVLPSGKNVFPEDVESHYQRSPLISEICVIGRRNTTGLEGAERLCAVVVPAFDYLRESHIGNAGESIRWELENLGRELADYQRVHDFVLRTKPLPRTATRKIRRFELRQELDATTTWKPGQDNQELALSQADWELMNSPAGRAISSILNKQIPDLRVIHPRHNLEVDFGLDSLARVEFVTKLEQVLGLVLSPEESSSAYTVGELVELANKKVRIAGALKPPASRTNQESNTDTTRKSFRRPWQEILADSSPSSPELKPILTRHRMRSFMAYLVLRLIYLCERLVFRLDVEGATVLKSVKPPYLLCPNHQSYIDPLVVGSVLPFSVFEQIIHVGASDYFVGDATLQIARLIKVVPIDPDVNLLRAMQAGAEVLRHGKILSVYPEGCRSFDGELGVLKKGAAILATELNVPIIPVALDGTYRIWPRNSLRLRTAKLRITFGTPIVMNKLALNGESDDAIYGELTTLLGERISRMLSSMRDK